MTSTRYIDPGEEVENRTTGYGRRDNGFRKITRIIARSFHGIEEIDDILTRGICRDLQVSEP